MVYQNSTYRTLPLLYHRADLFECLLLYLRMHCELCEGKGKSMTSRHMSGHKQYELETSQYGFVDYPRRAHNIAYHKGVSENTAQTERAGRTI